jgi:hypothetical protein
MRQAQVPTSSEGQGAAPVPASPALAPPGGAGTGPLPAPRPTDLSTFDVFQGREPPPQAPGAVPQAPSSVLRSQLATTQNQVMVDLFRHTSSYMEG